MPDLVDPEIWVADATDFLLSLPAGSADLVALDPPWGQTAAGWDVPLDMAELRRGIDHASHDGTVVAMHSQGMFTAKTMVAWADIWRYNLIWNKRQVRGFLNANRQPLRCHEDIVIFARKGGQVTYNPQFTYGHKPLNSRGKRRATPRTEQVYGTFENTPVDPETATRRHPRSIIEVPAVKNTLFSVQKPVGLLDWLIKTYTNEGDIVVDPTMGSGTALVSGARLGRLVIGNDVYWEQVRLTQQRLRDEAGVDVEARELELVDGVLPEPEAVAAQLSLL